MAALFMHIILCLLVTAIAAASRKNVLFLAADDMRAQLGVFPRDATLPPMHTPNLDALAGRSLLLKQAYVQQAVCNPSRTSLLTGRRPDTTRVYDLIHYWRKVGGNFTTIPQYFKEHGYTTIGAGKIFHPGMIASGRDDPISWSEPYYHSKDSHWENLKDVTWMAVNDSDLQQHKLIDQQTAEHAVQTLQKLKQSKSDKPFFLAVGFHRPHLPFVVPTKFFDMYPLESIKLPSNPHAPVDLPLVAWSWYDELSTYKDIKRKYSYGCINSTLPDDIVLNLRRAYLAAISYTDSLVGQVVDELERLGLANDTIISFWGDHGWQIGEHGEWCKHTNFELATHAPMMVRVPGLTDTGVATDQLTEFVDLFPSLVDAAGLTPLPLCPADSTKVLACTEGTSFVPLMKDPKQSWKAGAFSQYPRMAVDGNYIMGYTMRTAQYRYTEWVNHSGWPEYKPDFSQLFHHTGAELYDHSIDPDENVNRAFDPKYAHVKDKLRKQLHAGWRAALPNGSF